MRQTGTVVKDAAGNMKVSVTRPKECEHCGMCDKKEIILELPAGKWSVGDKVEIDMPADRLLKASALTYVLPLALLILGLLLGIPVSGWLSTDSNLTSLALGLLFMVLAFVLVKVLAPHLKKKGALDMDMTPCGHSMNDIITAQGAKDGSNGGDAADGGK